MALELRAPAGGPEPFRAALAAGADAIYCAWGDDFNARRSAENFTPATFAACCREAHLAGTRVYVTINIVIQDDEIWDASRKWWEYWKDYWLKRSGSDPYETDYACEVTIPTDMDDPQGKY